MGLPIKASAFNWSDVFVWATNVHIDYIRPVDANELTPQEYLKQQAGPLYGLLNRIVIAESGWKSDIKNKTSTASGLFQYLDSTFQSFCINKYELTDNLIHKNDPYVQIDCAIMMIKAGGIGHWSESKKYWNVKN